MDVVAPQPCGDLGRTADKAHQGIGRGVVTEPDHEVEEPVERNRTPSPRVAIAEHPPGSPRRRSERGLGS